MTKQEFVRLVSEKSGVNNLAQTEKIIDTAIDCVKDAMFQGDKVGFQNFGTFKRVTRAARAARNPRDGSMMSVPAKVKVKFAVAKLFTEALNQQGA